jgi:hypothetical protein
LRIYLFNNATKDEKRAKKLYDQALRGGYMPAEARLGEARGEANIL